MSNLVKQNIEDALFEFSLEADQATLHEFFKEENIDIEEYSKTKRRYLFLAKAHIKQAQNENTIHLVNKFQEAIKKNLERPISVLKDLIQSNPAFALYNNLDHISKEDIIEIIKDRNLADLLDQLEQMKDEPQ